MPLAADANRDVAYKDIFTPLHLAAQNDQAEVIEMLLTANANKDAANREGLTPSHLTPLSRDRQRGG